MTIGAATCARPRMTLRRGRWWITYRELELPGLFHGVVVFKDLPLDLSHAEWTRRAVSEIRPEVDVESPQFAIPLQTHGGRVEVLTDARSAGGLASDGVVTTAPGTMIGVSVSDCVPLLAVNVRAGVVGVAHCGWKGIASGVVEELYRCLASLVADSAGTKFLIGVSIGQCCYEVREDLLSRFAPREVDTFSVRIKGRVFFDLKGLVSSRLAALGADASQISIDKTCTSCKKYVLSSYRREGRECGRMLAVLMLTP